MSDVRATIGVLFAGVALLVSIAMWGGIPHDILLIGGAVIAFISFSGVRHGIIARKAAIVGTGVGSIVLVIGGVTVFLDQPAGSIERIAGGFLLGIGGMIAGLSVAEYYEVPADRLANGIQVTLLGAALGLGGLVVAAIAGSLPREFLEFLGFAPGAIVGFALSQAGIALGFFLAIAAFLFLSDRPLSYLDFRRPSTRDLGYIAGGTILVIGASVAIQLILVTFGVEFASHQVEEVAEQHGPAILLIAIVFAFVTNGLGEELLYRNGVQKYLAEWFSPAAAIFISSVIFAVVHFPAYGNPDPVATVGSVVVVFSLSIILGIAYHRTKNILVPVVIHGAYNAFVWVSVYVSLFV